jgi:ATP-dependent RNA helicase DDX27
VTLVGESDRKMLKAVLKQNTGEDKICHRVLKPAVVAACVKSLNDVNEEVLVVIQEEKEEKAVQRAEMELRKGQNMIKHEQEIFSRPARSWFQTVKEKEKAKSKISALLSVFSLTDNRKTLADNSTRKSFSLPRTP